LRTFGWNVCEIFSGGYFKDIKYPWVEKIGPGLRKGVIQFLDIVAVKAAENKK
jgi:two-component SAPR family response regulator